MNCFYCDETAVACCVWCGRGLCHEHAKEHEHSGKIFCKKGCMK